MENKIKRQTGGTCYESAWRFVSATRDKGIEDFYLVHGTVYSVPWRKRIGHAWVEAGDVVFDSTINFVGRKEQYYKIGNGKVVKRYTTMEAMKMAVKMGTYGPWNDKNKG